MSLYILLGVALALNDQHGGLARIKEALRVIRIYKSVKKSYPYGKTYLPNEEEGRSQNTIPA